MVQQTAVAQILRADGYLFPAILYHPNPHHLAPAIPHTVFGRDPDDGCTAAPTGFGNGDLILILFKPPPVVSRPRPAAGDSRLFSLTHPSSFLDRSTPMALLLAGMSRLTVQEDGPTAASHSRS